MTSGTERDGVVTVGGRPGRRPLRAATAPPGGARLGRADASPDRIARVVRRGRGRAGARAEGGELPTRHHRARRAGGGDQFRGRRGGAGARRHRAGRSSRRGSSSTPSEATRRRSCAGSCGPMATAAASRYRHVMPSLDAALEGQALPGWQQALDLLGPRRSPAPPRRGRCADSKPSATGTREAGHDGPPRALAGADRPLPRRPHDRPRRDDRERRAPVDPRRSRVHRDLARVGRQRLSAHLRRLPAAGRAAGRPLRPAGACS